MIIVDTGPLVAVADADDQHHERCVAMFRAARRPWLVPHVEDTDRMAELVDTYADLRLGGSTRQWSPSPNG